LEQMARGAYEFRDALLTKRIVLGKGSNQQKEKNHLGDSSGSSSMTTVVGFEEMKSTHEFLDRFYLCRIGIRVLIGQYLALRQPPVEHYVGIICSQTSPYEIVKRAIDDAAFMCTRRYGDAPQVMITGKLEQTFPYVPTHLRKLSTKQDGGEGGTNGKQDIRFCLCCSSRESDGHVCLE